MSPEELKHLDYIQSTISRMATNQFQIKGWLVAIDSAILTVFANSFKNDSGPNPYFLLAAIFPTVIFWILDSNFLSKERRLRRIYMEVAQQKETVKPFDMPLNKYKTGFYSPIKCMFSLNNILIYLTTSIGFLVAFFCLI